MATVTRKGQITLPRRVRDALGLTPGSQVDFVLERGQAILRRQIDPDAFDRWQGHLRGKLQAGTVDELIDHLRGERPAPRGRQR